MKSFSVGLLLCFSLSLVFADRARDHEVDEKALAECNVTNPVQRNLDKEISASIIGGYRVNLTQAEKCHLLCFYQKVKFLNEDGNIYNGQGLFNYTMREDPKFFQYSDIMIASIYQLSRSIKGIEDKCHKAFVAIHQYGVIFFTLQVARSLEASTDIKDEVVKAMETGNHLNVNLENKVEQFLRNIDRRAKVVTQKDLKKESITSPSN